MIDRPAFHTAWARLEERFGPTAGADAYLRYLDGQGLDTAEFEGAAAAVWATARFFPRPADFLLASAGNAWQLILEHVPKLKPPVASKQAYDEHRAMIPERAWRALVSLGGPSVIWEARDLTQLRREFMNAYELVVVEDARTSVQLVGPPKSGPRRITG